MLLIAIVDGMTIQPQKRANLLNIPHILVVSIFVTWKLIFLKANDSVTGLLIVATSDNNIVDVNFSFIQKVISSNLPFLMNHVGENLQNGWNRVHHQNMRSDIVVLLIQVP